jgi:hypothetical protein
VVRAGLVPAVRAGLARKRRWNLLDADAVLAGFVREPLLEFAERPGVHLAFHLVVFVIHPLADVGQVFDGDVRTAVGVGFLDYASRDGAQAVQHEAVFSPRKSPEYLLGGASAFVLKASTHAEVVVLSPQEFPTVVERPRNGHGDVLQIQVHAHHAVTVALFNLCLDYEMEVERVLLFAVVERPHPLLVVVIIEVGLLVAAEDVVHGNSAIDRGEGGRPVFDSQCPLLVDGLGFVEPWEWSAVAFLSLGDGTLHYFVTITPTRASTSNSTTTRTPASEANARSRQRASLISPPDISELTPKTRSSTSPRGRTTTPPIRSRSD